MAGSITSRRTRKKEENDFYRRIGGGPVSTSSLSGSGSSGIKWIARTGSRPLGQWPLGQ